MVETFGTGKLSDEAIITAINDVFDLRPSKIISELGLRRPIYKQTASYGHFGREDLELPWEELNKLEAFKKAIKA
jgi:S-adenosylmethionine synthetase